MADIVPPDMSPIVDENGRPTAQFFQWLQLVTKLDPIFGEGTPEGAIEARVKRLYFDTVANTLYIKKTNATLGDRTKGWQAV